MWITTPDYLIVGGWHHGGANFPISKFLDQVQAQRSKPPLLWKLFKPLSWWKSTAGDRVPCTDMEESELISIQMKKHHKLCVFNESQRRSRYQHGSHHIGSE
jgi:hypothetical protein